MSSQPRLATSGGKNRLLYWRSWSRPRFQISVGRNEVSFRVAALCGPISQANAQP